MFIVVHRQALAQLHSGASTKRVIAGHVSVFYFRHATHITLALCQSTWEREELEGGASRRGSRKLPLTLLSA